MKIGLWLIIMGIAIAIIGVIVWLVTKLGVPFGKLPGDIHISKEKVSIYIPIVTSIVVSVLLTLIVNFILWLFRK